MISGSQSGLQFPGSVEGFERNIVDFFARIGYSHTNESWRWMNRGCPFGDTVISFGVSDNRVVAHFAVLPVSIDVGGRIVVAGLGIHLGVDMDFRSVEHFIALTNNLYKKCEARGMEVIFGFPNDNSWLPLTRLSGWKPGRDIVAFELDTAESRGVRDPGLEIVPVTLFDDPMAALVSAFVPPKCVSIRKTSSYLSWRYVAKPAHSYFFIRNRAPRTSNGYLVAKSFQKDGKKHGQILEWGGDYENAAMFRELVYGACRYFASEGASVMSCWLTEDHPQVVQLKSFGFTQRAFATHFGFRLLGNSLKDLPDRWFLAMGDSDAY